jgi:uncharacterized protein YjbI with pentapeptide repeats
MGDELPPRPTADDRAAWRAYWAGQDTPWRTEPEIDADRQVYLTKRQAVTPDIKRGIYPFRDEHGSIKLSRADVEWLLAMPARAGEPERAAAYTDQVRDDGGLDLGGLDLRGADLGGVNLRGLPLVGLRGSLTFQEALPDATDTVDAAAIRLERANLRAADLDGALLRQVNLRGADLREARLTRAQLYGADLSGARLGHAELGGANMRRAIFSPSSNLYGAVLRDSAYGTPQLRDVQWNGVDVTILDWSQVPVLGDEQVLRIPRRNRPSDYPNATRANRQLATLLRGQGLNEDADRYAYRAQVLQRHVLLRQWHLGRAVGSWLLDAVSGYGYKPVRSVLAYVLIIGLFAGAYLLNAQFAAPHLTWDEALVLSISSFHGRGFFTTGISLGDTLARLAAGEAIIGLLIEITFIATFTQRFFAR